MGLADWALKVGLAQMDPHPEGAHTNQPIHAVQDPPKEEKS